MALTLTDLQKMIEQQDGLYPLDMYRANTPRQGIGSVNIPNVNLQGAPNVTPGTVLDTSQMSGAANLPTARLSTGTTNMTDTTAATGGNRLDDLISGLDRDDISRLLLSGTGSDNINLGNIDRIANELVNLQYPDASRDEKSEVTRIITNLFTAGQSPEFQKGFKTARTEQREIDKAFIAAKRASKDKIYGKLLDVALREDKNSTGSSKIVNVFRPDIIEGGGSIDDATQNARIRTTTDGEEILEVVAGQTEDGSNIYEIAPAETVIINNPGQLKTLREGAQGKINSKDYRDGQKASVEKVVAAGNILTPVNQMLDILQGANTPADVANVTGALFNVVGRFKTNIDTATSKLLGTLSDDQQKVLANTNKLFNNLGTDNQTSSANNLENAVDDNGDPIGFKWSELGSAVADSAVYKALFLELAYYSLLLKGQESRAVSDKDIINALRTIGGDASTPQAAMRTIINFAAKSFNANERETRGQRSVFGGQVYKSMREQEGITDEILDEDYKGAISTFLDPNNIDYDEFQRFINYAKTYGSGIGGARGPYELYLEQFLDDTPAVTQPVDPATVSQKSGTDLVNDAATALGIQIGIQ